MKEIMDYLNSWERFRADCEKRAKGRCVINSSGWGKLRQFHLENYLKNQSNPFMFLLTVKWKDRKLFDSHRMSRYYYTLLRQKAQSTELSVTVLVDFPTWRNNVHRK